MSARRLRFPAAHRYDTRYLANGDIKVEGIDIDYCYDKVLPWPLFHDLATEVSYDIGEQALSSYLISREHGKPVTAIPAFPSRIFPHVAITVRRDAAIETPKDLEGKQVGTLGFGWNTGVWARGILQHQYDVAVERIVWVEDSVDRQLGGLDYPIPSRFHIERQPGLAEDLLGTGELDMEDHGGMRAMRLLEQGVVDAFIAPAGGPPLTARTRNLFPDPVPEIHRYVTETGVFPINTVIILRTDRVTEQPDLPQCLLNAFHRAKARYNDAIEAADGEHMGLSIPFLRELGLFPSGYGLAANRRSIQMMIQYCYEQGVIRRLWSPEELFERVE